MALTKVTSIMIEGAPVNPAGRKNLIINGGMDVWQRGTSFTDDSFTADRWYINSGSATLAASRQAFPVGQTDIPHNPKYFLRVSIAGSSARQLIQKVEDVSQFSGQTVTLSYWAKSDVQVTPDCRVYAIYDGSSSEIINSETNVSVGSSWTKYTNTFTVKSFSGKTIGSNSSLQIDWTFFDDTTYVFDVANIQLELGSVATDFEHRSYGEELALCQRYYRVMDINIGCLPWAGSNSQWGGESRSFDPMMRSAPTVTQLITPTYSSSITTVPAATASSGSSVNINTSAGADRVLIRNNTSGGTLFAVKTRNAYDAEL